MNYPVFILTQNRDALINLGNVRMFVCDPDNNQLYAYFVNGNRIPVGYHEKAVIEITDAIAKLGLPIIYCGREEFCV